MQKNIEDMQQSYDIVEEVSIKEGLELNTRSQKDIMVVSRNNECPQINTFINWNQFKHLGTLISNDGRYNTEIAIENRANKSFQRMK